MTKYFQMELTLTARIAGGEPNRIFPADDRPVRLAKSKVSGVSFIIRLSQIDWSFGPASTAIRGQYRQAAGAVASEGFASASMMSLGQNLSSRMTSFYQMPANRVMFCK